VFVFLPDIERARISTIAILNLSPAHQLPEPAPKADDKSFAELLENFRLAKAAVGRPTDWIKPLAFLERLRTMQPKDPYVIQQLALATYKSEQPDELTSLQAAKQILEELSPRTSSDAETVGLWGAIHKRLWEQGRDRLELDEAIRAYERGFHIKNDYYNGINYAFLLDVRAALTIGDEALTDRVLARRVRTSVLAICNELLSSGSCVAEDKFWIEASKVEAFFGLGRKDDGERLRTEILGQGPEPWKVSAMADQLSKLEKLLQPVS
jgi:MAP3K TRAFs-binding domain